MRCTTGVVVPSPVSRSRRYRYRPGAWSTRKSADAAPAVLPVVRVRRPGRVAVASGGPAVVPGGVGSSLVATATSTLVPAGTSASTRTRCQRQRGWPLSIAVVSSWPVVCSVAVPGEMRSSRLGVPAEAVGDRVAVRAGFGQAESLVGGDGQAGPVHRGGQVVTRCLLVGDPGCPGCRARAATSRRCRSAPRWCSRRRR